MADFRSSLAPLFQPDDRMRRLVAPRHGLTDVRPVFKWYLGDLDKLVAPEPDALTTSGGDPLTTVAADPITTAA